MNKTSNDGIVWCEYIKENRQLKTQIKEINSLIELDDSFGDIRQCGYIEAEPSR